MPFISYAKNFEDVILWRALCDVENGFYVDIGAADPQVDSVTHAFYERGWSGINVEPLDEHFTRLTQERPRDTNLKVAVGREAGIRSLYAFDVADGSTLDPKVGARHKNAGFQSYETAVPVLPLMKILEDFRQRTIHFLKIDVEGVEAEVLESLDLDQIRPWIIVVEASEPNSTISTRAIWEHLITNRRYNFAYFDGLNCFYVADETHYLKEKIAVPVNVFDEFVRSRDWVSQQRTTILEQELIGTREHAHRVEAALQGSHSYSERLERELSAAHIEVNDLNTALLSEKARTVNLIEALQAEQGQVQLLCQRTSLFTRRLITKSARRAMGHPFLLALGRWLLKPFPRLTTRLYEAATKPDRVDQLLLQNGIESVSPPASVEAILRRLQSTFSQNNSWNRGTRKAL